MPIPPHILCHCSFCTSRVVGDLQKGDVKSVDIKTKDNTVDVTLRSGSKYEVGYIDAAANDLVRELKATPGVQFNVEGKKSNGWLSLLT